MKTARLMPDSLRELKWTIKGMVCAALFAQAAIGADTNYWTGDPGGSWHETGNWSLGKPVSGQDVRVETGGDLLLTNATPWLASFVLDDGAVMTVEGWQSALNATNMTIAGTITHLAQEATEPVNGDWIPEHRIVLTGSNITIAATGELNADLKGYPLVAGPGASASTRGGAGHASRGGNGTFTAVTLGGPTYGEPDVPEMPGSGGSVGAGNTRGLGGGAIRVAATGQLAIHGLITANADHANNGGGGGSGGSIWLSAPTIDPDSDGTVSATGGNGNGWGGSGSGGRIAVHYQPAAQAALGNPEPALRFFSASGTCDRPGVPAFMGSLFLPDTLWIGETLSNQRFVHTRLDIPGFDHWHVASLTLDDCIIGLSDTNGFLLKIDGNLELRNNAELHIRAAIVDDPLTEDGARVMVGGNMVVKSDAWVVPYAHPTNGATVRFDIAGDLTVETDAGFFADALGYDRGQGPGRPPMGARGGGAYGGDAQLGRGFGDPGGLAYGDPVYPIEPGSGSYGSSSPAEGGGAIRLYVSGDVFLDGLLTANGHRGWNNHSGSGSGGGILVMCRTLSGSGRIRADAGTGTHGSGGYGGGGRIAIHYDTDAQSALPVPGVRFSTYAVPGPQRVFDAQMGTLYLSDAQWITETLDNRRFWYTRLVIPDFTEWTPSSLTLDECVISLPEGFHLEVAGDMIITNDAILYLYAAATNSASDRYGMRLEVNGDLKLVDNGWIYPHAHTNNGAIVGIRVGQDVVIDASSGIDADARGYFPGFGTGQGGNSSSGGSHGGLGAGTSPGMLYGLPDLPLQPGSPGGWNKSGDNWVASGRGGGVVHLLANGVVHLDGLLSASATHTVVSTSYAQYGSPGGSGGSILVAGRDLRGTGLMRAIARDGGGGRIAVWLNLAPTYRDLLIAAASPTGLTEVDTHPRFHGLLDAEPITTGNPGTTGFFRQVGTLIIIR